MDAFFESLREVSVILLPILGVAVLVFLLILLKHLIDLVKKLGTTVDHVDATLNIVDDALEELKAPISTLANVAHGIDTVQAVTVHSAMAVSKYVVDNFELIKQWITGLFTRRKTEPEDSGESGPEAGQ